MSFVHSKYYEIEGLKIEWSKTLYEVRPMLDRFEKLTRSDGWPNIRCKCSHAFGLPATEFEISARFEHKPVLKVQYLLAPIKSDSFEALHLPYLEGLEKYYGKPSDSRHLHKQPPPGNSALWPVEVFNATWLLDSVVFITLSVYGGARNKDSGSYAASVSIEWLDEDVEATKPPVVTERSENLEELISEHIKYGMVLKKFKLERKLSPSEKILDKQTMFQTPEQIRNMLEENEVALYKVERHSMTFISTKWDTIFLTPNDKKKLLFYDILPARGQGSYTLYLGEMSFGTSRESSALPSLVQAIETQTGLKIAKEQYLDE